MSLRSSHVLGTLRRGTKTPTTRLRRVNLHQTMYLRPLRQSHHRRRILYEEPLEGKEGMNNLCCHVNTYLRCDSCGVTTCVDCAAGWQYHLYYRKGETELYVFSRCPVTRKIVKGVFTHPGMHSTTYEQPLLSSQSSHHMYLWRKVLHRLLVL